MLTRAELRTLLHERGLHLTKRLGQNMLVHAKTRDRMVEAMELMPSDTVVEIGAGTGALTEAMAPRVRRVVAYEVDRGLAKGLSEQFDEVENVEVRHRDFLDAALDEFDDLADRLVFVGNLPYSITTPAITHVLESTVAFRAAYLTMQREVAQRLLAKSGTRERGAISLLIEYHTEARRVLTVPRTAFEPVPEVESVLLALSARPTPPVSPRNPAWMFRLIRAAYGARRKVLKNALRRLESSTPPGEHQAAGNRLLDVEQAMERCGLSPTCRAEELTLRQFADLSDALGESSPSSETRP